MSFTKPIEASPSGSIFEQVAQLGHEQVVFCHDAATGLRAIVAVHNTVLGPGMGGTRFWNYATEAEALHDALRLSRGMSFKNAIAGLNLGGGKAVIIGDPRQIKTEALLRMYGKFIEGLSGKYITAEDVGMTDHDMEFIGMETSYVSGMPEYRGGSGSPAVMTALGTYVGMKAAAKKAYGSDSLQGKRVAVQGAGAVADLLIGYLLQENATVYVNDVFEEKVKALVQKYGPALQTVGVNEIYDLDVDIYSPCALGATVNDQTLERLKCHIIAGCANNQLADEQKHGNQCIERGMLYVPDFVINCGGVINIATEIAGSYNRAWAKAKTEDIYNKVAHVLNVAAEQQRNAQEVAMELAMQRITQMAHIKTIS